jgi:hypothetical protein
MMRRRSRRVPLRIRYLALIASAATAVACVTTAPASAATQTAATPAAATAGSARTAPMDSSETTICLTNSNSYCMVTFDVEGTIAIVIASYPIIKDIWAVITKGVYKGKHEKYAQIELEDNQNGLCLADTFGDAYLASCGADGTIWLVVPHSDGAYLESRYTVDNGIPEVLTADPLSNNSLLYAEAPANPGSPYWQTWTGYPSFPTA